MDAPAGLTLRRCWRLPRTELPSLFPWFCPAHLAVLACTSIVIMQDAAAAPVMPNCFCRRLPVAQGRAFHAVGDVRGAGAGQLRRFGAGGLQVRWPGQHCLPVEPCDSGDKAERQWDSGLVRTGRERNAEAWRIHYQRQSQKRDSQVLRNLAGRNRPAQQTQAAGAITLARDPDRCEKMMRFRAEQLDKADSGRTGWN